MVTCFGIPSERGDVVADPAQRLDLVEKTVVAGHALGRLGTQRRVSKIPQQAQSIVDRDENDALLGELYAVVQGLGAASAHQRAAVNPNHHRQSARTGRAQTFRVRQSSLIDAMPPE